MKRRDWATRHSRGWQRSRDLSFAIDSAVDSLLLSDGSPLWFVTSVAAPTESPLSYSPIRSFFDTSQRIEQTLETIESIREVMSLPKIVVIEGSRDDSISSCFRGAHDVAVVRVTDPILREAVDSPFKGLGEAAMLVAIASTKAAGAHGFWKISGRYCVRAGVSLPTRPSGITGKMREGGLVTVCFGVESCRVPDFGHRLSCSGTPLLLNRSLEVVLGRYALSSGLLCDFPVTLEGRNGVNGLKVRF